MISTVHPSTEWILKSRKSSRLAVVPRGPVQDVSTTTPNLLTIADITWAFFLRMAETTEEPSAGLADCLLVCHKRRQTVKVRAQPQLYSMTPATRQPPNPPSAFCYCILPTPPATPTTLVLPCSLCLTPPDSSLRSPQDAALLRLPRAHARHVQAGVQGCGLIILHGMPRNS